jgi:hypothetical protein
VKGVGLPSVLFDPSDRRIEFLTVKEPWLFLRKTAAPAPEKIKVQLFNVRAWVVPTLYPKNGDVKAWVQVNIQPVKVAFIAPVLELFPDPNTLLVPELIFKNSQLSQVSNSPFAISSSEAPYRPVETF